MTLNRSNAKAMIHEQSIHKKPAQIIQQNSNSSVVTFNTK